jgi:hypothetical protein
MIPRSSVNTPSSHGKNWDPEEPLVLTGRSINAPPIELFHPLFNQVLHNLENVEIDSHDLTIVFQTQSEMKKKFALEEERATVFRKLLSSYLGKELKPEVIKDIVRLGGKPNTDGTVLTKIPKYKLNFPVLNLEVKNELAKGYCRLV